MRAGILVAAAMLLVACSGADEGVRIIGSESGSGSGTSSASGTASGTSSEEGSGSASGVASEGAAVNGDVVCAPPSEPTSAAVAVTLTEWEVGAPERVPSGPLTITAGNIGGDTHELVIVRGDDPEALPVADGRVQEDQLPDGDLIGEIESFPAGDTCAGRFELPPGDYVFFCNIVEEEPDGTVESHFLEGMHTVVTAG